MEDNVFKVIENLISNSNEDWFSGYDKSLIYAIIFGLDNEQIDELLYIYKGLGFTEEDILKIKMLHLRWESLKTSESKYVESGIQIKKPLISTVSPNKVKKKINRNKNTK